MFNKYQKGLLAFSIFFYFTISISNSQDSAKIRFEFIKLDNEYTNWGELKLDNVVFYDSLDQNGNPINIIIQKQIKLITFKFNANNNLNAHFRYKLLGIDGTWSKLSQKNEVSYYKLNPGKYNFIVQLYLNGIVVDQKQFKFQLNESSNNSIVNYTVTFFIYSLIFSIYLSFRTGRLKRTKKILEQTVKERTSEIVLQKDEISLQKHIVEEKHREISDSINYAKRIQSALLTSQEYWDAISPDNFVIWRPKDVVSGDFHWAYQITIGNKHLMTSQEIAVWCAADCTGHGVPGAFMSMLGMSFLNEIVIENVNLKPADILNKLRKKIINALEHGGTGHIEQKDGMDIALCVWHKNNNILEYAGANNPVWIMRPIKDTRAHEIIELKANRMPVGYHYDAKDFTDFKFQLQKGDAIYVFTDGFVDQFGGT
jgi:serine phosphatase RsbU (regulator of sigma subunit)